MAQKHKAELTDAPMTRFGPMKGPDQNKRILRSGAFVATKWTAENPILQLGEVGYETDTNMLKIGDGVTAWNDLGYVSGGGGTSDYSDLENKPQINGVTLSGDKSSSDLHLQDSTRIETLTTASTELSTNTIYNGDELASVTLTLPNSVPADFIAQVEFSSGATPTTFTAPATLYFNGDACNAGVFTPVASKRYCMMIISDGVNVLGFVYEK